MSRHSWRGHSGACRRTAGTDSRFLLSSGSHMQDALVRLRHRYWPDHLLGEVLSKRWTETAIPVIVLLIVAIALARSIDGFLSAASLGDTARQAGEIGFVVLGM